MSKIAQDFADLLRVLSDHEVRFLVVGAHALGVHGRMRSTGDLDVWVESSVVNARKTYRALAEFGAPLAELSVEDLSTPGVIYQIGVEPGRIDILTAITGVEFGDAWQRRVDTMLGGQRVAVPSLEDLLTNKRATGRAKDLLDVAELEKLRALKRKEE